MDIFEKTPEARLDYVVDWTNWLPAGLTIDSSTWSYSDDLTAVATSLSSPQTSIILSGGTEGETYIIKNIIETTGGSPLKDSRVFKLLVTTR